MIWAHTGAHFDRYLPNSSSYRLCPSICRSNSLPNALEPDICCIVISTPIELKEKLPNSGGGARPHGAGRPAHDLVTVTARLRIVLGLPQPQDLQGGHPVQACLLRHKPLNSPAEQMQIETIETTPFTPCRSTQNRVDAQCHVVHHHGQFGCKRHLITGAPVLLLQLESTLFDEKEVILTQLLS